MIGLQDIPARVARLPRDERGYPIPRFVATVDGKPDFRVIDNDHWMRCVMTRCCWICGQALGRYVVFVCGPSTAVTGVTSEPGSHLDCATFALKTCPFIMFPNRSRDEIPEGAFVSKSTVLIDRNPGVWLQWATNKFEAFRIGDTVRIRLGRPAAANWFRRGEPAGDTDAKAAIETAQAALPAHAVETKKAFADFLRRGDFSASGIAAWLNTSKVMAD